MTDTPTYKCLLCGVDHPIVNGRVNHTAIFGTDEREPEVDFAARPSEWFQAVRDTWARHPATDGMPLLITALCDEVIRMRALDDSAVKP